MELKHTFLVITTFVILLQSCDKTQDFDRDGLTYKDKLVYNYEFRLDGYYYSNDTNNMIMFYLNGSIFHGGYQSISEINNCPEIRDGNRRLPYLWGYFIIESSVIKVQSYSAGSLNAFNEFKIDDNWYEVINDTTIRHIKYRFPGDKFENRNDTLRFYHCFPKPDSTNILMD